eukprot:7296098-Prymnesium_polylepis.1
MARRAREQPLRCRSVGIPTFVPSARARWLSGAAAEAAAAEAAAAEAAAADVAGARADARPTL